MRTYGLLGMHCGSAICSPLRDSRSDGVAQNGLVFFDVDYFPCFRIVGFSSRTDRASAFLPKFFHYDGILCVLVLCVLVLYERCVSLFL